MCWKSSIVAVCFGVMASAGVCAEDISYTHDIKPVIDTKCIVCHACFDAPCQLVLTHADGLARGASKQPVYDGLRVSAAEPTRLFIDEKSTGQWRDRGFFPVLPAGGSGASKAKVSVLEQLLLMHEFEPNKRLPQDTGFGLKRDNFCPSPAEMEAYGRAYPNGGMPLGVTGLTQSERESLLAWIRQGAPIDTPAVHVAAPVQREIRNWEAFLNHRSLRRQLLARWLYEHLFMAHLYFRGLDDGQFFQLVRSRTPSGKPVDIIATRRPNDDPGRAFFYRLWPVQSTIVHKTHVTFALDKALLGTINALFLGSDWEVERLPGYADAQRSNPFQTFAPIPAEARYRFMLDHAEYFVRTFIRGPVCHGQIATGVIREQFWVFFQAPDSDLYVTSSGYRNRATPFMDIAGVEHDLLDGAKTWFSVKDQYDRYVSMRQAAYDDPGHGRAEFNDIWDGEGENSNALLTVFRHHDNASVRKGLIGDYPRTVWWMDYPLFERGYYNLVVNFDVFGSIAHQTQTRLYFDLIRNDAERNFLRLLPAKTRQPLIDKWYQGSAQLKLMSSYQQVSDKKSSGIRYATDDAKREFLDRLLYSFADVNERPDTINRGKRRVTGPADTGRNIQTLRLIAARPASELPAVKLFPDVSFLRVFDSSGTIEIYTLIRNRMHSNVAFMFAEDLRYQPEQDTLTLYRGVLASYPGFIFNVHNDDVDKFVDTLLTMDDEAVFARTVVNKWGVRRTHPRFWELFHKLSDYLQEHDPVEAGVMDMSRYENL